MSEPSVQASSLNGCHTAERGENVAVGRRQRTETKMTRPTIAAAAVTIVMSLPFATVAGPHPLQQQLQRQLDAAKAKQEAAEKATGSVRQSLTSEHLQMMQEAMQQMQATKPQAGTSMEEYQEWILEQQKLMEEALQQMIVDNELLMQGRR